MLLSPAQTQQLRCLVESDPADAAERVKSLVAPGIRECFGTHGWDARLEPIGRRLSTLRSILVPMRSGGFTAVVNARRRPTDAEIDWLLAHEYAHTFFYLQGEPPHRAVRHTAREEEACDRFADAFIGVELATGVA